MEPDSLFDLQRPIWKVLPLHPQPQPLESFTSYIVRLAEANGLKSIRELAAIAGTSTGFQFERRSADYPHHLHAGLAQLAGCALATVQKTTFFHLGQHFGCSTSPSPFRRFLQGSLAPSLRYCPRCLAEHAFPYYSLIWRFSPVPGCIKHHCTLLDHCGHCRSPIPHVPLSPRIARCPTCQGDLRTCRTLPLPHKVLHSTRIRTRDLEMLLSPPDFQTEGNQAKVIGKRVTELRQHKGLSTTEMASLMKREELVVLDIEHVNPYREAAFGDYLCYADLLGYSLQEVFDKNRFQEFLAPHSEEQMLTQVEAAIEQLGMQGKPVTEGNIGELVGVPASRLKPYPRIKKLLNRCHKARNRVTAQMNHQREEVLFVEFQFVFSSP